MSRIASQPTPLPVTSAIPTQSGVALAAMILGGLCVPLAVYVGVQSLAVSLPTFGVWYFLPVVVAAIALGMFASRTAFGVAGAVLGVVALLVCVGFVILDRSQGAAIRAQITRPSAPVSNLPAGLSVDQIMRAAQRATTLPTDRP